VKGKKVSNTANIDPRQSHEFLGHPMGLWVLFTTEMWERFCYYGMRAFLVMYLYSSISGDNPGFGWSDKDSYELYGMFTGLVYLLPLFCGFLADRFLGQHHSVVLGGVLMAAGEFCLFFTEYFRAAATAPVTLVTCPGAVILFMFGLFLIIVGNGFFKPCISTMVGQLYKRDDSRKDVAFTIFYMGINVGALLAPFVAGTIAEKYGWHYGFLVAGLGMIFGLCTYTWFRPRYLNKIGMVMKRGARQDEQDDSRKASGEPSRAFSKVDIDRIVVILVLTAFCIAFWSIFEQAGTSLNTFAKRSTNRQVSRKLAESTNVFLANEDEKDAKTSFDNLKINLVNAEAALSDVEAELKKAQESLLYFGRSNPGLYEKISVYNDSSQEVESLVQTANRAIRKAKESRKKAGLPELDLTIPSMTELLNQGKTEKEEIDRLVEQRYQELFDGSVQKVDSGTATKDETEVKPEAAAENQVAAETGTKAEDTDSADQAALEAEAQMKAVKAGLRRDIIAEREQKAREKENQSLDKSTAIYTFPATWYQSINPLGIVLFAPLFAGLWGFLSRHKLDPSTPVKFGAGLVLLGIAFLIMVGGAIQAEKTGGNASAYWLVGTYVLCTFGELCLSPVGLSMVSKLAPPRYVSLLMGVWFLSSAVAGYMSGKLPALLGSGEGGDSVTFLFGKENGLADYYLLMALIPLVAGIIVFILSPKLRKMMHEND